MSTYPVPGMMNGPEDEPAKDVKPNDEKLVEMLEDLLPKGRAMVIRNAKAAGAEIEKRKNQKGKK